MSQVYSPLLVTLNEHYTNTFDTEQIILFYVISLGLH